MKKLTWDEARVHLPEGISPEIYTFATDEMFAGRHYLFVWFEKNLPVGYCTRCHKAMFLSGTPKHNSDETCPNCRFDVITKHRRFRHTKLIDFSYFVWYDKSPADPGVVVARGFLAKRDLRRSFREVETVLAQETFYVFRPGIGGQLFIDRGWHAGPLGFTFQPGSNSIPYSAAHVYSLVNTYDYKNWIYSAGCEQHHVADAVKGTPLQYVPYATYWGDSPDLVKLFDLACRYPSVEYLTKLGCKRIVSERLVSGSTNGAINWKGKTPAAVLKVPKEEVKSIISKINYHMGSRDLALHQVALKHGDKGLTEEHLELAMIYGDCNIAGIGSKLTNDMFHQDIKYLHRQMDLQNYRSTYNLVRDFKDYLRQCTTLEMDSTVKSIRHPKNLDRAHQNLTRKIKFRDDAAVTEKIRNQQPALQQRYGFESDRFFIRPAASVLELIKEGNALHHCVGSYSDRYASGSIAILFLRSKKQPNRSFYTIEVRDNQVLQCRGRKNRAPSPDVEDFLSDFKAHLTAKPKRRKKAS